MRSSREEDCVRLAVDSAEQQWERALDAWDACTWALVRDPQLGEPLNEAGTIRSFVFDGARSISMPSIDVIYEFDAQLVMIKDAKFYDAPHHYAGRA